MKFWSRFASAERWYLRNFRHFHRNSRERSTTPLVSWGWNVCVRIGMRTNGGATGGKNGCYGSTKKNLGRWKKKKENLHLFDDWNYVDFRSRELQDVTLVEGVIAAVLLAKYFSSFSSSSSLVAIYLIDTLSFFFSFSFFRLKGRLLLGRLRGWITWMSNSKLVGLTRPSLRLTFLLYTVKSAGSSVLFGRKNWFTERELKVFECIRLTDV